jgi:tetratricopeptide (TPR) repeat protein
VVECASVLNADGQFVLDMREVEETHGNSSIPDPNVRAWSVKYGKTQGIVMQYQGTPQHITEPWEGGGIEISTFGLGEGRSALIRYRVAIDKGNRSYFEVEAEGPEHEVDEILKHFKEVFAPPSDREIDQMKEEMEKALEKMEWGATQDYANLIMLWRPDDVDTLQALGSALIISRDHDSAEKVMHRLLELKPDSYAAYMNLGNVWMNREDYDKAIGNYTKMMELAPGESFGPYILATAYEAKGDPQGARPYYEKAASMKRSKGPTDFAQLAREALERLA